MRWTLVETSSADAKSESDVSVQNPSQSGPTQVLQTGGTLIRLGQKVETS